MASGEARSYTRLIADREDGAHAIECWMIEGASHAWAGGSAAGTYTDPRGPDASAARFFNSAIGSRTIMSRMPSGGSPCRSCAVAVPARVPVARSVLLESPLGMGLSHEPEWAPAAANVARGCQPACDILNSHWRAVPASYG